MINHIIDFIGNPFDTDNPVLAIMQIIIISTVMVMLLAIILSTIPIWLGPFLGYRIYKVWQEKKVSKLRKF